jgi:hypothetical protein
VAFPHTPHNILIYFFKITNIFMVIKVYSKSSAFS